MTRLEDLTLKLADDSLSEAESRELELMLQSEPAAAAAHTRLLEIEAALRGQRETLDLAGPTPALLRAELGLSVERGVMQRLATDPLPAWSRSRLTSPAAIRTGKRWRLDLFQVRGRFPLVSRPGVLALAASVVLLFSLSVWYFSPTMGQPVLAEVKGLDVSVARGTEFVPATNGMLLQAGDALHLGTNASATITFGAEDTRLMLSADTELKLTSLARGKRFVLQEGRVEANVARQRPFHPLIITTPQAQARVLGTKFSLLTADNATRLEVTRGSVQFTRMSDSKAIRVNSGHYAVAANNYDLAAQPFTGSILREYWTNLPGESQVDYLLTNRDFPDHPSGHDYLKKFESPSDWGSNYGARIYGYLHPPRTGEYTFWLAAGDGAKLFLSPDDNPKNKGPVGYTFGTAPHEWTRRPGQQSPAIPLVAGRKYYIEVLQKQGEQKRDHLAVAWSGPGRELEIIPGKFLSPFKPKDQK